MGPVTDKVAPLAARLGRLRGAIRALFALDGLSRLVLAAAAFVAVTFAIDWTFLLPTPVRLVLLAGGFAVFAWIFLRRILRPLAVRVSDDGRTFAYLGLDGLYMGSLACPCDLDNDGDVDQKDLDLFTGCASGPAIPLTSGCENRDFDHDNDVDQADFGIFQRCLSGPNIPADPNCAD